MLRQHSHHACQPGLSKRVIYSKGSDPGHQQFSQHCVEPAAALQLVHRCTLARLDSSEAGYSMQVRVQAIRTQSSVETLYCNAYKCVAHGCVWGGGSLKQGTCETVAASPKASMEPPVPCT